MQIIILAAGEGKRIRSLTKGCHKSLLPINSSDTFLSRMLHQLNEYEISKLIVITGYASKEIETVVKLRVEKAINKMNLVRRDEFEIWKKMVQQLNKKNNNVKKKPQKNKRKTKKKTKKKAKKKN